MKLTECKDCGKEISKRAAICPSCGVKNSAGVAAYTARGLLVVFGGCLILLGGMENAARTLTSVIIDLGVPAPRDEVVIGVTIILWVSLISNAIVALLEWISRGRITYD